MKKNTKTISFPHAAAELRVSDSTILRLVRRGALRATKPELVKSHWTRRIVVDKAFLDERARRLNGLRAPRRKPAPAAFDKSDPSPIQTVTPQDNTMEQCRNAMNICLGAQKACESALSDCKAQEAGCHAAAQYCARVKVSNLRMEDLHTRCTAVLAAAGILQLILAAYYTLCHFNII